MAFLDEWLERPVEREAAAAKRSYVFGIIYGALFLGHVVLALAFSWEMTWVNVALPMVWLQAMTRSFAQAEQARLAYQQARSPGSL